VTASHRPTGAPRHVGGRTLAAETVREALHAVATPTVAARILHRALHMAKAHEIPGGGAPLQRFVERHLGAATLFVLGEDAAEEVVESLRPLVQRIPSVVPRASEPARLSGGMTPAGGKRRMRITPASGNPTPHRASTRRPLGPIRAVLVASLDGDRIETLERDLAGKAHVAMIQDVVALLDALQVERDAPPCIVVDCLDPSVQPATLATVASEMPPGTTVVLWGATDEQDREARIFIDDTADWVRLAADAGSDGIAETL